jgi:hypothetical protein
MKAVTVRINHNEALVSDIPAAKLSVDEMEKVIAPGATLNHSKTLL